MCPTTGRKHIQGYIEFEKRVRIGTLRRAFPGIMWFPKRGTTSQCVAYCTKNETRFSGPFRWTKPGVELPNADARHQDGSEVVRKTKLDDVLKDIKENGLSIKDVSERFPAVFVRSYAGVERYISIIRPQRSEKTHVMVVYGPPGSGKSRHCFEWGTARYGAEEVYKYDKIGGIQQEWWDGYRGQKCVILDEMGPGKFAYDRLLTLLDRYPTIVPFKGGSSNFNPEAICITSNLPPPLWFPTVEPKLLQALIRRIDICFRINILFANGEPVVDSDGEILYRWHEDPDNMNDATDHTLYNKQVAATQTDYAEHMIPPEEEPFNPEDESLFNNPHEGEYCTSEYEESQQAYDEPDDRWILDDGSQDPEVMDLSDHQEFVDDHMDQFVVEDEFDKFVREESSEGSDDSDFL